MVTDAFSKKLVSLRREYIMDVLLTNNIQAKYLSRRSFATWDILQPSAAKAVRLSTKDLYHRNIRLQPEYWGCRRTNVSIVNIPVDLSTYYLMAYLNTFGA